MPHADDLHELRRICWDWRYSDEFVGSVTRNVFGRKKPADSAGAERSRDGKGAQEAQSKTPRDGQRQPAQAGIADALPEQAETSGSRSDEPGVAAPSVPDASDDNTCSFSWPTGTDHRHGCKELRYHTDWHVCVCGEEHWQPGSPADSPSVREAAVKLAADSPVTDEEAEEIRRSQAPDTVNFQCGDTRSFECIYIKGHDGPHSHSDQRLHFYPHRAASDSGSVAQYDSCPPHGPDVTITGNNRMLCGKCGVDLSVEADHKATDTVVESFEDRDAVQDGDNSGEDA